MGLADSQEYQATPDGLVFLDLAAGQGSQAILDLAALADIPALAEPAGIRLQWYFWLQWLLRYIRLFRL